VYGIGLKCSCRVRHIFNLMINILSYLCDAPHSFESNLFNYLLRLKMVGYDGFLSLNYGKIYRRLINPTGYYIKF
jgi:hypothetical protein